MTDVANIRHPASPVPVESLRTSDPRQLGDFRILGRLGAGGMGIAFLAERGSTWSVVKMFRSELTDDDNFGPRMARELEAMQRASGPHTAKVLEQHLDGSPAWFAMEFIPGMTLTKRLDLGGPLVGQELVVFAAQLKEALDAIHVAGLVHRDLKPSNIILSPDGPKLIDFGIADVSDATQLTSTGHVLGTIGWLAPEQVSGDPVSPATDLHAWGLCVLFAATGRPPFGDGPVPVTMAKVLNDQPEVPSSIPEPLRSRVRQALNKAPSARTAESDGTREFIPDPTTVIRPRDPEQPRRLKLAWLAAGVVGLVAAVGLSLLVWSNQSTSTVLADEPAAISSPATSSSASAGTMSTPAGVSPSASTVATETQLPAPQGVRAIARDSSVELRWNPVDDADSYVVLQRLPSGELREVADVSPSQVTNKGLVSAKINDLVNGRNYSFVIAGETGGVVGKRSRAVRVAPEAPSSAPSTPVTSSQTGGSSTGSQSSGGSSSSGGTGDSGPTLVLEGDPNELVLRD